jgi:hypothetical protein
METEDYDILDTSWIDEEEQYLDKNNYKTKCLENIKVCFVFLNNDGICTLVHKNTLPLYIPPEMSYSKLDKNILKEQIKSHQTSNYELLDLQLFYIPIHEHNLQSFCKTVLMAIPSNGAPVHHYSEKAIFASSNEKTLNKHNTQPYLMAVSLDEDIILEPSIRLFHDIYTLYVFFKTQPTLPKSILKKDYNRIRSTKKVSIYSVDQPPKILPKKGRETRKKRIS